MKNEIIAEEQEFEVVKASVLQMFDAWEAADIDVDTAFYHAIKMLVGSAMTEMDDTVTAYGIVQSALDDVKEELIEHFDNEDAAHVTH